MKDFLKNIVIAIITIEAKLVLKKYKPQIIAVTGSVGKTTTKDAIALAVGQKYYVGGSQKSFNSEIGVPLSVLGCDSGWNSMSAWLGVIFEGLALIISKNHYPKWLVVEIGVDRPGDIRKITEWLVPDVVVVTRLPKIPVHVEFFKSREDLIHEKTDLARALKDGGVLVLNRDDEDVYKIAQEIKGARIITYGTNEKADVRGSNVEFLYNSEDALIGMTAKIEYRDKVLPLQIQGMVGTGALYSALAGFAVGAALDVNMVSMITTLGEELQTPGRSRIIEGTRKTTIIDDSYNASPAAVSASLATLGKIKTRGRKIAVLGDMLELGDKSEVAHAQMGKEAKENANVLVTVGEKAKFAGEEAYKNKMQKGSIFHFNDSYAAGEFLRQFVGPGDVILVKGSQRTRMERVVEDLMREPHKKIYLLARQGKEWRRR